MKPLVFCKKTPSTPIKTTADQAASRQPRLLSDQGPFLSKRRPPIDAILRPLFFHNPLESTLTNNDILRRVRYTFDFKDQTMVEIFALANRTVTPEQVTGWLKKDDHADFVALEDSQLAAFLNGLIIFRRGARDGEATN